MNKYIELINNNDLSNSDLLDKINNDSSITDSEKNDLKLIIAKKIIDLLYKYKSFDISLIGDQILVDLLNNEPGLTEILSISMKIDKDLERDYKRFAIICSIITLLTSPIAFIYMNVIGVFIWLTLVIIGIRLSPMILNLYEKYEKL
jgi:hypothetical protein